MTRAGQCSSQMPLWLKWRQAWQRQAAGGHWDGAAWCANGSRAMPEKMPTPCVLEDWPKGHIPGSQNAWGPCSLQHTAHGSSQWAAGPCIGHSHWCRWYQSLLMRRQDGCWVGPGQQTLNSIALPSRRQLIPNKSPHHSQLSTCPPSPTSRCPSLPQTHRSDSPQGSHPSSDCHYRLGHRVGLRKEWKGHSKGGR